MRKSAELVLMCVFIGLIVAATAKSQSIITTRAGESGRRITVSFEQGEEWTHTLRLGGLIPLSNQPQIAVWAESSDGRYLGTLYVTHRTATQDWRTSNRKVRRPETLPCWAHRQGRVYEDGLPLPTKQNPLSDAITSATPKESFTLDTVIPDEPSRIVVYAEINHSYDFNRFFSKSATPGDREYSGVNGQPSAVYAVELNPASSKNAYEMRLTGYGSPDGSTGAINPDVSPLTTAKEIVHRITVRRK